MTEHNVYVITLLLELTLNGLQLEHLAQVSDPWCREYLGQQVYNHVSRLDEAWLDSPVLCMLAYKLEADVDVLRA